MSAALCIEIDRSSHGCIPSDSVGSGFLLILDVDQSGALTGSQQ
jgi:hypothetical protein